MRLLSILSFLFFLLFIGYSEAQIQPAIQWLKGYGGDQNESFYKSITRTDDGGFVLTISSDSHPGTGNIDSLCNAGGDGASIFLKFNAGGTMQWSKCIGYSADSGLLYMFPTADGNFVFGGLFKTPTWGFYITKHDAADNIIWQKSYSKGTGPVLRDMIKTMDNGYLMAGQALNIDTNATTHYGSGLSADVLLLKLDSNGNKQWSKVVGGSGEETIGKIIETRRGMYYIVGTTNSSDYDCIGYKGGASDGYVIKLDSTGNILWHRDFGGMRLDAMSDACRRSGNQDGLVIAGTTTSSDGDVHHHTIDTMFDFWVIEIDGSNNIQWENCYGRGGQEYTTSICKATDGSVWIGGGTGDGHGGQIYTEYGYGDAFFVHADSVGHFLSSKVLGSTAQQYEEAQMLYPLSNGMVIAGGMYNDNDGSFSALPFYQGTHDIFLVSFANWTTNIQDYKNGKTFTHIYPNPACDNVLVDVIGNYNILITDAVGKPVYNGRVNDKQTISTVTWARGIYYVQIIRKGNNTEIQKLVVQ